MHLFTINQTVNSKYTIKNYKLNKSWKRSINFFPNINLTPVHWPELSSIHWDCTIITIPTESDKKYINFKSATTSIRKKEFPVQPNLLPYSVKIVTAVFLFVYISIVAFKRTLTDVCVTKRSDGAPCAQCIFPRELLNCEHD